MAARRDCCRWLRQALLDLPRERGAGRAATPLDPPQQVLLERYVEAFDRYDMDPDVAHAA